eukprot:GHRR01019747.1.p1 GENE.GHRR01019747.1~~GHRR01019747.1.p1  ORF type:complete len:410 (-),score=83.49 GHRR01019747.1:133-1362(-)
MRSGRCWVPNHYWFDGSELQAVDRLSHSPGCLCSETCLKLPRTAVQGWSQQLLTSMVRVLFVLLVLAGYMHLQGIRGSEGDASEVFRQCHASCLATGCTKTPGNSNTCDVACPDKNRGFKIPVSLQLMRWDCADDCSYNCMWAVEGLKASASAGPVFKYFGKWPFLRVLGTQEIVSVLCSIANMLAHVHNLQRYVQHIRSGKPAATGSKATQPYPYHWLWLIYSVAHINAWLWSAVFHCRDTEPSEKLDYFSADLVVVIGLLVAVTRTLQLQSCIQVIVLGLVLFSGLVHHIYYMSFVKFHYGYNMHLCIAIGLVTAAAWLIWAATIKHPARQMLYQFMVLMHAAMLLEVLDFPPMLWLFDAHALWHAATVPLTYLWYRFIFADIAWVAHGASSQHAGVIEGGELKQKQ